MKICLPVGHNENPTKSTFVPQHLSLRSHTCDLQQATCDMRRATCDNYKKCSHTYNIKVQQSSKDYELCM